MTREDQRLDTPREIRRIAEEMFVYGYPLVLMDITRRRATNVATVTRGRAPMNAFNHARTFPDHRFTAIVRPNADTLYSSLWYDVSREPLIVDVPDSEGRYYVLTALDMWTDQFCATGTRTTGNKAQRLAFVGAGWQGQLPADVHVIRCPTVQGWLLGRAQTNGVADFVNVHRFQTGLSACPLSRLGSNTPPEPAPVDPDVDIATPPPMQVEALTPRAFVDILTRAMAVNVPHPNDYPILHRMSHLGIEAGRPFDWARASPETRAALDVAWPAALNRIKRPRRDASNHGNGWRIGLTTMGSYGTDYARRAAVAYFGLGAVGVEDAVYPSCFADSEGKPFDSGVRYRMHFSKDDLPPARAFWSLTMYDARQYFTENPIGRYAIGDRDALVYNADGSLDLFLQRSSPGAQHESNWLPTPAQGKFSLNLRLYWPDVRVLDGAWFPPLVVKVA